jgi:hypothetical protein
MDHVVWFDDVTRDDVEIVGPTAPTSASFGAAGFRCRQDSSSHRGTPGRHGPIGTFDSPTRAGAVQMLDS